MNAAEREGLKDVICYNRFSRELFLLIKVVRRLASYISLVLLIGATGRADDGAMWKLYTRALENQSTAPNYILITLIDGRSGTNRAICIEAPFLLGAIHRERKLEYDSEGQARAMSLALAQTNRAFKFSDPDAIKNVQPRYTEKELEETRNTLKQYSNDQLRQGLTPTGSELQEKLFGNKTGGAYGAYRDAVAHVLLERGLLPRQGDSTGSLTVDN